MYDYVIVTHIPAFYKVNLYNELSKELNIYVIFVAENTTEQRANDFSKKVGLKFEHVFLNQGSFQSRKCLTSTIRLRQKLLSLKYRKMLVSGWDLPEFWYGVFFHQKQKNYLALESSAVESQYVGIKGWIKRFFLNRVQVVLASGKEHLCLLNKLKYKGNVRITHGVGVINKPTFDEFPRRYKKKFLFIGRLSEVKNLHLLIEVFNKLPEYSLTIIGDGPLSNQLKKISKKNITFRNQVDNKALVNEFLAHDILILPSRSEPWGLVIEEALYFGLPVIASRSCGASELIMEGENGFTFDPSNEEQLASIIQSINSDNYIELTMGVAKFSIHDKDIKQIEAYV